MILRLTALCVSLLVLASAAPAQQAQAQQAQESDAVGIQEMRQSGQTPGQLPDDTPRSAPASEPAEAVGATPLSDALPKGMGVAGILERDIVDAQGGRVGTLEDFMVGDGMRLSRAIMSVGGVAGLGGRHVAVPMDMLRPADDDDALFKLDASSEDIDLLPTVTQQAGIWRDE